MIHKNDFDGNLRFGGCTFHRDTGRSDLIESVQTGCWGRDFFENKKGEIHPKKDYFEDIDNCLVCNSDQLLPLINRKGLNIVRCQNCGFGMQNPRFKEERIKDIYKETYCMDDTYSSQHAKELDELKFLYGIQQVRAVRPVLDSVLDIGCGQGLSLAAYKQSGIPEVVGLETGKYSEDLSSGMQIINRDFASISSTFTGLSLITLWDVLEHVHDFKSMLENIYKALDDNGIALIMVPNLLSLASRLIRSQSPTFAVDHLNYFTDKSLTRLLEDVGFTVMLKETIISEIDNCRNYLEFKEPYFSEPQHEKAFDWLTPNYIHENMLGSRLLFVAQKN
jgi:2-polyprenyl-3-methyl-5-hydroxy-6-metoxy-1,4-benzoquinol methylase